MPIEFHCTGCSKLLRTADDSAGKRAKCPQCGTIVEVPADSAAESSPGDTSAASPFARGSSVPGEPEPFNPYAVPQSAAFAQTAGEMSPFGEFTGELTARRISFDDALRKSWDILFSQFGYCVLLGLTFLAVTIASGVVTGVTGTVLNLGLQVAGIDPLVMVIVGNIVQQIIGFLINTFWQIGIVIFSLHLARMGEARVELLFHAATHYGRGLLMGLVAQLVVIGLGLLFLGPAGVMWLTGQPAEMDVLALIGGAVLFVPVAIYIQMCFFLGMFFVVDRSAGPIEALTESNRFMSGNRLPVFVALIVIGILGMLVTVFTCCLGILAVFPYGGIFAATVYLLATGQPVYMPPK